MAQSQPKSDPRVINLKDRVPDWDSWSVEQSALVQKIVVGPSPGSGDDEKSIALAALPADFAERFPALTHLYLWGLKELRELPNLPVGLQCLDLRGCADLVSLPSLPESLETLDLGGCTALSELEPPPLKNLRRLYFNQCGALESDSLTTFLRRLHKVGSPLEELDGSNSRLADLPKTFPGSVLKKLVLKECTQLESVGSIGQCPELRHLNLSGCTTLRSLPELPPKVEYLVLHGADRLEDFAGQDIGPYDRGTAEGQNVILNFRSRQKFGKDLAASAHAKLLLLGDGRVGKSTLAKRLQWETLTDVQKRDPAFADRKPRREEDPTHKMRFWRWEAPLVLPPEKLKGCEDRAAARGISLPVNEQNELNGAIRLWDFGGQEIYHNTHRIFAGEGSVFLLVWRAEAQNLEALQSQCPSGVDATEWAEWNRQRPLDYWLDYIDSIRPNAKIALVCTCCSPGKDRPDWTERAPRYAQAAVDRPAGARKNLRRFYVDSLDDGGSSQPEFLELMAWVKQECGLEADRIGILQPAFFGQVADQVDRVLAENDTARRQEEPASNLLLPWQAWSEKLRAHHQESGAGIPLDDGDIEAITGYLHDAGQIFRIQHEGRSAVLVDQEWATGIIYEMLRPGGTLHKRIVKNGGWIRQADFERDPHWEKLRDDLQREQLIRYLQQSRVLVKVMDKTESRSGQTIFVANEKWLLPREEEVRDRLESVMARVRSLPHMSQGEKFSFESVGEFEFRDLMADLGGFFGRYATWFRNGLQAVPDDQEPDWCFRLSWQPAEPDSFQGRIEAILVGRSDHRAVRVEQLFATSGGPLSRYATSTRKKLESADLRHEFLFPLRPGQEEVGVSSSGGDEDEARELVEALKEAGIKTLWYRLPECRLDENAKVMTFMEKKLRNSPCMIFLLSDAYLKEDPINNWYCPWELADGINLWLDEKRTIKRTIVVYRSGQVLTSKNLDEHLAELFRKLAGHFSAAYKSLNADQWLNFRHLNEFSLHFAKAWQGGSVGNFFRERGTLGTYARITAKSDGRKDYSALIDEVRKAIATR